MTAASARTRTAYEPPSAPPDSRLDRRKSLLWSAVLQTARGPAHCTVLDISRGGARLSMAPAVTVGQAVTLVVTGMGMFRGTVAWGETGNIGISFAEEPGAA